MCVCVCVQHQNFEEHMQGMKTQLIQLSSLLRLLDVAFTTYLGTNIACIKYIRKIKDQKRIVLTISVGNVKERSVFTGRTVLM